MTSAVKGLAKPARGLWQSGYADDRAERKVKELTKQEWLERFSMANFGQLFDRLELNSFRQAL